MYIYTYTYIYIYHVRGGHTSRSVVRVNFILGDVSSFPPSKIIMFDYQKKNSCYRIEYTSRPKVFRHPRSCTPRQVKFLIKS